MLYYLGIVEDGLSLHIGSALFFYHKEILLLMSKRNERYRWLYLWLPQLQKDLLISREILLALR